MIRIFVLCFGLCLISFSKIFAQDSNLLDLVKDSVAEIDYVTNAFKSTRVINGQSIEMLGAGSLDFRILHRFGPINSGANQLFGLDQSTVRFSFDYAPFKDLLVGVGRSSLKKELDGFIKYRLLHQSHGSREMPISVILVAGMTLETLPWDDLTIPNYFTSRLGYFQQIIVGSKMSDMLSLQISPTIVHRNLVEVPSNPQDSINTIFAVGFGGRIKITNRIALTVDYYHAFNGMVKGLNYDALAVGFDIETGGHIFQVHISNSVGMNERAFIMDTSNNWAKGGIQLGFNISRIFQL